MKNFRSQKKLKSIKFHKSCDLNGALNLLQKGGWDIVGALNWTIAELGPEWAGSYFGVDLLLLALREARKGCDDLYQMLSLTTHHVLKQNILEVLCIMEGERNRQRKKS